MQSKFIYFAGCLKRGWKSPCTHSSPRVQYKPSSHLCGENCTSMCSTLFSWSLSLAEASSIFSSTVAGELVEGSSQESLHHQLVQMPKLGEVAPMWVSSCPFRFCKVLYFCFVIVLHIIIIFISFLHLFYFFCLHCYFSFCILFTTFILVALVVASFYFQFSF
jgi:hypothetical protein